MKTSELTEAALDWAVARCEGLDTNFHYETKRGWMGPEYQSDWAWGGPIIERERITLVAFRNGLWAAEPNEAFESLGDTPLVAAMRCYVASKLGDEIEIPEELL